MTVIAIIGVTETCAPPITQRRCPGCRKVLFYGTLLGSIKCPRCGSLVKFGGSVA